MTEFFSLLWEDYTFRTIALGTAVLGAISGMLGSFAVLRKESLLGDAISHAALPGIAVAFLLTGAKTTGILLMGAAVSAVLGVYWIRKITTRTHLKSDTALGLILSVFFGFGMLLLTFIQKLPDANQAGLDKYLFGQAATLVTSDVQLMASVTLISLLVLILFWKEFKIMLFDSEYAHTLGIKTKFIDSLISFFIIVAIILGLQTVGVVLMSAILLAPAAAARQWTNSLATMVILAGVFGALSGVFGTAISATQNNMATGPVIVLVCSVFVGISLIFSPSRGLLMRRIRHFRNRQNLERIKMLQFLYNQTSKENNVFAFQPILQLKTMKDYSFRTLKALEDKGFIILKEDQWAITDRGIKRIINITEN